MKVTMHETGIDEAILKYVVIVARQGEQWIMAKHRERSTWEFAGGHIEPNESPDEAAARELYEETGAEEYTLHPISIYSVVSEGVPETFGKLYLAAVHKFGQLPLYEMGGIKSFAEIPEEVTYPMIYPALLAKVKDFMRQVERI